jgi:flagellar motor protein MotB
MPPLGDLAAACKKAKAEFRPLGEADVERAKNALSEAIDRLDERLTQAGTNGDDWRKYLGLAKLRSDLQQNKVPDQSALDAFSADHEGLELVWFVDVQKALQNYLSTSYAAKNPQAFRSYFDDKLGKLADSLGRYISKPTTEDAAVISESLSSLEQAHQVPTLVQAIQHCCVQPNLVGQMSAVVVGAGIVEPVDDTQSLRDCILGTDIHSTAHTVGQTSVELQPDPDRGLLDTLFFGTTHSDNIGYHGPVTIYSSATTRLAACKRLWIEETGLSAYPGVSNAVTEVQICDIQSNKGRRLVERMAWKRAGQQQGEAEQVASRHAEARLNERVDQQAADPLERANRDYVDKFYRPFTERKLFPQLFHFSTTERAIGITGLLAGCGKLAAPSAPPAVVEGADMSLRLHESAINNLAFDALAGRTVHEEKVQAAVTDALGKLPEKMKGDEDGQPWAITLATRQPISVTFADDGWKITIRGVQFQKGSDVAKNMNISAAYKIGKTPQGFKAVRQGKVQVAPTTEKKSAQQVTVGVLLEKRFAKIFEPEILGQGLELGGRWKAAGKLMPIQVACRDGWLTIAWKRSAK